MSKKKPLIPYSVKLVFNVISMTFIVTYLTFFLLENFAEQNSLFIQKQLKSDIYLLDSSHTRKTLNDWGTSEAGYSTQLDSIAEFFSGSPYRVHRINGGQIKTLTSDSVLLVIDAVTLSNQNLTDIESYVNQGGSLLINYQAGFNAPAGDYRGGQFIQALTGLELDIDQSEQLAHEGLFITPRLFSPITQYIADGNRLSLVTYDQLPLFKSGKKLQADVYLTNWARSNTPETFYKQPLPLDNAGVMWHGLKEKGRWVYFNFPSYVFNSQGAEADEYNQLFNGAVDYLRLPSQLRLMPYLNQESATVVFEDVEYQYETLNDFIDLAEKYQIPVTTYQVAKDALAQPEILKRSQASELVEVASHSYSHGPIIKQTKSVLEKELTQSKQKLSSRSKQVKGFRPPREEIDDAMIEWLIDADYGYVLAGAQDKLYPEVLDDDFILLPRTGTDDYEYFVTGKMTADAILKTFQAEESLIRALNGVYTLGVHTHLMTYGDNIKILDNIFDNIKQNKQIKPLTAAKLVNKVNLAKNIEHSVTTTNKNHIINLSNHNGVKIDHLVLRLYWQGSLPIKSVVSEIIGTKITAEHFVNEKYTDIHVRQLKANATMSIIARYE